MKFEFCRDSTLTPSGLWRKIRDISKRGSLSLHYSNENASVETPTHSLGDKYDKLDYYFTKRITKQRCIM
jgi:hypothetical protein